MSTATQEHVAKQPDVRKMLRQQSARLMESMDCELESAADEFVEWWKQYRPPKDCTGNPSAR